MVGDGGIPGSQRKKMLKINRFSEDQTHTCRRTNKLFLSEAFWFLDHTLEKRQGGTPSP